jgi:hypothetical protein
MAAVGRPQPCRRTGAWLVRRPTGEVRRRPDAEPWFTQSTHARSTVQAVHCTRRPSFIQAMHARAAVPADTARTGRRSRRPSFTQATRPQTAVPADHCPRGPSFSEATHSPGRRSGELHSYGPPFTRTSARRGPPPGGPPLARTIVHTAAARTGRHTFGPPRAETAVLRDLLLQPTAHTGRCFHSPPCSRAAAHAGGRPGRRVARTARRSDTVSRTAPRPNAVAHASRRPGRRSGGPSLARAIVLTDPHQNRPPSDSRSPLGPRLTQTRHAGPSHSPSPARTAPPTALARSAPGPDGRTPARAGRCPARSAWVVVLAGP